MTDRRTALQCQVRGCDGCVVCDKQNYTPEDLAKFRRQEEEIQNRISQLEYFKRETPKRQ